MKKFFGHHYLKARVTHLEMTERPEHIIAPPANIRLAFMRAHAMPIHFYRYIYDQIGHPHHWNLRRNISDESLSAIIHNEKTHIHILYVDGCPAGFAETGLSKMPEITEIIYFGLVPDYQGRGLSRFFFNEVLLSAWDNLPEKVIIQTNTLDSPRALQIYQKAGFEPVAYEDVIIEKVS